MKQVHLTLNIPEEKYDDFIHYLSQNFDVLHSITLGDEIPEWHKEIVRKRKSNTKKDDFITIEELTSRIRLEDH